MTAANEKPLPCPFCGNNASLNTDDDGRWQQVVCMACGAKGPERATGYLPDAVAAWNRRAQPAEGVDEAKEREAFEKWCKDNDYATSAPKWAGWLARARGGK